MSHLEYLDMINTLADVAEEVALQWLALTIGLLLVCFAVSDVWKRWTFRRSEKLKAEKSNRLKDLKIEKL